MKRIALILLTLVMLMLLVSCGSNKYAKYDALIDRLEADDYEGAYAELVDLAKANGAIGNNDDNEDAEDENEGTKEPETEIIEINSDNWQEYFEIRRGVSVHEDAFGDVENVYVGYRLHIKDAYLEKTVRVDLAIEYLKSGNIAAKMEYDIENDVLTIGEELSEEYMKEHTYYVDKDATEQDTTTFSGDYELERGVGLGGFQGGWQTDSFIVENGIAKWDGGFYTQIELPRVEGTLTIEK